MTVMQDVIAEELAKLERIMDAPVEPFGFGSDISCSDDIDPNLTELDGVEDARLILAQAIVRRLDCPRGALPDDPNYGIDLRADLNRGLTDTELSSRAGKIRGEVLKDDRVDALGVVLTPSRDGSSYAVELRVTPKDPALGGFSLTLAVTDGALLLKEIGAA